MTFLKVDRVKKVYENQSRAAVQGVELSVEQGEIVALVGESGSGKSTLLNIIAGLLNPDEGQVFFKGEKVKGPVDKLVPGHEEIKVVFQHYDLMPFHTVEDNIRFIIRGFDDEFQDEKLSQLTEVCALEGFLHKKPGELSGGQQQRVAIAKALASEPELLLMDEPFSSVDSQLKAHLESAVFEYIKAFEMTCVFVTHDHKDALSLSERIVILKDGKKHDEGTPQSLYYEPLDPYVASFFGAVNIFSGKKLNELLGVKQYHLGTDYLIRGEFITISDKGLKSIVKQRLFMGHYEQLLLESNQQRFQVFTTPNQYQVGDQLFVEFELEKLISLS